MAKIRLYSNALLVGDLGPEAKSNVNAITNDHVRNVVKGGAWET